MYQRIRDLREDNDLKQKDLAAYLQCSQVCYSNYENGYSEPPAEIIIKFCDTLDITLGALLEVNVATPKRPIVKTYADLLYLLIDLDRRGLRIKGNTTYSQQDNQLMAHLTLDIKNAQLATFIPDWNSMNEKLTAGLINEEEYQTWLENTLRIFNVEIEQFV